VTPKQERFVAEYLIDGNGTRAYIAAGYSKNGAAQSAERLLRNAEIAAAIAVKTSQQLEKVGITAERVKERLATIAFADIRDLHDTDGNLKPLSALTKEQAAVIAQFEVIKKNAAAGDGVVDTVHKVRLADQMKALEMLGKHFGLFVEKVEHSGAMTLMWAGDVAGDPK
jgi:phage terminase small subunit